MIQTNVCTDFHCHFLPFLPRRLSMPLSYSIPLSLSTADFDTVPTMYRNGTPVFAEPLSLPDKPMFLTKKRKKDTSLTIQRLERVNRLILVLKPPIVRPTVHHTEISLEGRRACVRARPQRRSNKERKWPLLACRRFFLVSYASFIIICFDASFLDVVSCEL